MTPLPATTTERRAGELVDLLVDSGPLTRQECCARLHWTEGSFGSALRVARNELCPDLELAIPAPTPANGWRYQVTMEWEPVNDGAVYGMALVDSRLRGLYRDVRIVLPHLPRGSKDWRRANFLSKHLLHLVTTLQEINDG